MKRPAKVCAVVTARPSYSRIFTALRAIDEHDGLELSIVTSGSAVLDKYGSVHDAMAGDGFEVTASVHMVIEGDSPENMARTTGLGLLDLPNVFSQIQPDYVISIADRFETIATSIAAAYMNIPLVHVQGGEVSGSIDDKVRDANTMLADLHLVATEGARKRVLGMGVPEDSVAVTGCPSIDLAAHAAKEANSGSLSFDPYERYGGVGSQPSLENGYIVVLQHPVTQEFIEARVQTRQTLDAVASLELPVLWFWPNMDAGAEGSSGAIRAFRERGDSSHFHFFKNMTPGDFLELLLNSKCLVGNSSVGIRECSYLGVPVVNIGTRQTGRERGVNVRDVAYERNEIEDAVASQIAAGRYARDDLYGQGNSGKQIADCLAAHWDQ